LLVRLPLLGSPLLPLLATCLAWPSSRSLGAGRHLQQQQYLQQQQHLQQPHMVLATARGLAQLLQQGLLLLLLLLTAKTALQLLAAVIPCNITRSGTNSHCGSSSSSHSQLVMAEQGAEAGDTVC
jgi:hypothetical protein